MKSLSPLLLALALAASGCASSPSGQLPTPAPAATAASGAAASTGTPLDRAAVEKLVRDALSDSQIENVRAELKDLDWVDHTLGPTTAGLSASAPMWVVVATGRIRGGAGADLVAPLTFTYTAANFVVAAESGTFLKTHLTGRQPTRLTAAAIGEAAALQAVRDQLATSRLDDIQAELKTFQWIADNLASAQGFYTTDSPVWVVTATGELKGDSLDPTRTFHIGKYAVDASNGQILSAALYPTTFTPQPVLSGGTMVENTYLTPLPPSPHP